MSDDILFIKNNNSPKLVVYFYFAGAKPLEDYSLFSKYSFNKLLIRDSSSSWYNGDIGNISTNIDELEIYLKEIIHNFKKQDITFFGMSMGGYAALLLGTRLEVGKIVAISPQIILDENLPMPSIKNAGYKDISNTILEHDKTEIDLWFGSEEFSDYIHIHSILGRKNLNLYPVKGSYHNVFYHFKQRMVLDSFFDLYLSSTQATLPLSYQKHLTKVLPHITDITNIITEFYLHKNYEKALIQIEALEIKIKNWSGLLYFKGLILLELKKYQEAVDAFNTCLFLDQNNYLCSYKMSLAYISLGQMKPAETALRLSIANTPVPPPSQFYARLSETQQKQGEYLLAKENANKALQLDKNNLWAHYQLVLLHMLDKSYHDAIAHCESILKIKPDWEDVKKRFIQSHKILIKEAQDKLITSQAKLNLKNITI